MKKLLVLTSALIICGASIASAAPGGNLSWANCGTTATSANYAFLCDDNTLTRNLVVSFTLANNLPDYVGVSSTIDWQIGDPGTPDYFQYGPGGCREGAIGPINVGAVAGCVNPYAGTIGQGGGFVNEPTGPNRWRIRADWARADVFAATAGTRYTATVFQFSTNGAFDEGFGACAGCEVPACYVLNQIELYGLSGGVEVYNNADFRNWVTYQGGAGDCPGATPSKNATWGAVKALYR
jgi:hypothetical protein